MVTVVYLIPVKYLKRMLKFLLLLKYLNIPKHTFRADKDYKTFTFATTLKMSTYLVAFIVSDFVNLTDYDTKKPYSIWTDKDTIENARFALKESPKILDTLELFTKIEYHMSKMDEVSVPDFEAGAMENWGLVTYR